jgi:hypothetical protein
MRGRCSHRTFPTALRSCGRGLFRLRLPSLVSYGESHRSSCPEGLVAVMIMIRPISMNRIYLNIVETFLARNNHWNRNER